MKYTMRHLLITIIFLLISGSSHGAEFFIAVNGSDNNNGTQQSPWKTLGYGFAQIKAGDTLTLREGIYRMIEETNLSVINKPNIIFQSFAGERVQLFGSATTKDKEWKKVEGNDKVWRIKADFLNSDPKGMFNNHVRVEHQSDLVGGRDHDSVSNLTTPNTWTKANINGEQCFASNTGCYIYIYPANGEDPNTQTYELSQRGMARVTGDNMLVRNLEFYYNQSTAIFFEGADFVILDNNIFGNTSNGNDNSYATRIWDSQGSVVKNNTVFDSKYWGGVSNSKGITFMITKAGQPNIVENNEIYDIPGIGAVATKNGVSNLIVRYNYIHDVYTAFEPGGFRCSEDACQDISDDYRPGGKWKIYGNVVVNATIGVSLPDFINDGDENIIYNNVFHQVKSAVILGWDGTFGNVIANNIFANGESGIYLTSGATTTAVTDYLDQYVSHNNLFFNNSNADIHLRPNWGGNYYSGTTYGLNQFQSSFNSENDSLAADPLFLNTTTFELSGSSPALGAGDGSFWEGVSSVNIGAQPFSAKTTPKPPTNINVVIQ